MSKSVRLFISVSEEEFSLFEKAREELGMNRSQYLRYLIGGQKEIRPVAIKYKDLISHLANIDRNLKVIALKDELSDQDKMVMLTKLQDLKKLKEGGV